MCVLGGGGMGWGGVLKSARNTEVSAKKKNFVNCNAELLKVLLSFLFSTYPKTCSFLECC